MILLSRSMVDDLLDLDSAREMAREAFLALADGRVEMPPRLATTIPSQSATQLAMPCLARSEAGQEILCTKVASVYPGNPALGLPTTTAFLCLQEAATGRLLALMDAEAITATRTAAASALAADLLSRADAQVLGVVGAGAQAVAHALALLRVRPISEIRVTARSKARLPAFRERLPSSLRTVWCDTVQEVVPGADILCLATNASQPVIGDIPLSPATFVIAVGSFRPEMAEIDSRAINRMTVVVDQMEAAKRGAGELIQAVDRGALQWSDVWTLGELLRRRDVLPSGRPILFKSVGLAVQDAFLSNWVYERALRGKVGVEFDIDA